MHRAVQNKVRRKGDWACSHAIRELLPFTVSCDAIYVGNCSRNHRIIRSQLQFYDRMQCRNHCSLVPHVMLTAQEITHAAGRGEEEGEPIGGVRRGAKRHFCAQGASTHRSIERAERARVGSRTTSCHQGRGTRRRITEAATLVIKRKRVKGAT